MDVRRTLVRRFGRSRLAVAAVVASLASAAPACLPSIDFGAADAGADAQSSDAMQSLSDGGPDARGDAAADADADATVDSADSAPEAAPPRASVMASAILGDYASASACVVRDGGLYCWGDPGTNDEGQLGFLDEDAGGTVGILTPMLVTTTAEPASQIVQLVMNGSVTCALYGTQAYCWGDNGGGLLGSGAFGDGGATEIAVLGSASAGMTSIAAASGTMCGVGPIQDAGSVSNVYCWGYNGAGELGRDLVTFDTATPLPVTGEVDGGPLGVIPNAVQIAGGGSHFCALTNTHAILCWGATDYFECGPTSGAISIPNSGGETTCTVQPLEVTLPDSTEVPTQLAVGDSHSCVLTMAGNVYCWGADDSYQLGPVTPTQSCVTWYQPDASIPCNGAPVKVPVSNIQRIFAAASTSCAFDAVGHASCWGYNGLGQLGQGDTTAYDTPQPLLDPVSSNAYSFVDMAVGEYSVCGRTSDDTVYCWGSGVLGTDPDAGGDIYIASPAAVQF